MAFTAFRRGKLMQRHLSSLRVLLGSQLLQELSQRSTPVCWRVAKFLARSWPVCLAHSELKIFLKLSLNKFLQSLHSEFSAKAHLFFVISAQGRDAVCRLLVLRSVQLRCLPRGQKNRQLCTSGARGSFSLCILMSRLRPAQSRQATAPEGTTSFAHLVDLSSCQADD